MPTTLNTQDTNTANDTASRKATVRPPQPQASRERRLTPVSPGTPLDPSTPLSELAWESEGEQRRMLRRLPERSLKALAEQGLTRLVHLEGIKISHLMIVPQFGEGRARMLAEAARLAGVYVAEDAHGKDSITVSFSGPLVDLARRIVGQYLWMNPQDLIRKAVVENLDVLMGSMRDFTMDIRQQEAERIRAEIQERELLLQRLLDRSVPIEAVLPPKREL